MPSAYASNPFTDVKESDYFYDPVLWAVENGITNGISADQFGPDATCTRAQIVTFLYRYMSKKIEPLTILFQPEDYYMNSSMETADFPPQVKGGMAPYTFTWTIYYAESEPVVSETPIHVFSANFTDYDFDEYSDIMVGFEAEDTKGAVVYSELARVYPYFALIKQPEDHHMGSSQEDVQFTVGVAGNSGP